MDRLITEKSRSMSGSGYNDYDFGERGRLSSLLKVYAKKDAVDHLSASVEQMKSNIQFISEQKNQLELVGNRNTYNNERLNETLQDMKQVGVFCFCRKIKLNLRLPNAITVMVINL